MIEKKYFSRRKILVIGLLLIMAVIIVFILFIHWLTIPVYGKYEKTPQVIVFVLASYIIPNDATDIEYKGVYGTQRLSWKCNASEFNFLALANKRKWNLDDNIEKYNLPNMFFFYKPNKGNSTVVSKWVYNNRDANGSGISIIYDRTTQTMYGEQNAR